MRDLTESEGRAVLHAERAGKIPLGWDASDCFTHDESGRPTSSTRIYLGSDGVMVPTITQQEKDKRRAAIKAKRRKRGKKCRPLPRARPGADGPFEEFEIVTYSDEPAEHRLVVLTRRNCEHAGDKVALVDGAEWIRNQLTGQSLPLDAIGLDYYHFAENGHKARRAVYGEEEGEDSPGEAWAAGLLHLAKEVDYVRLEEAIWDWAFGWRKGSAKRKAALALLDYVSERAEMIRYKQFLEAGRQIGSGPTESMCKAATLRVKGVGKKWDLDNAEAVMALEALDQSGLWEKNWNLPPLLAL